MNRLGHRSLRWKEARIRLKETFRNQLKITACEFRLRGCWRTTGLSFAHAVKRRFLREDAPLGSPEHIETVALACLNCHTQLDEHMSHAQMRDAVMDAIRKRS